MDVLKLYGQAQDGFDAAVADVEPDRWDTPSPCAGWSVRDVAGHVTWAQRQLRAWATGEDYDQPGGPGTPHPAAVLADADPLAAWREARADATDVLTAEALTRPTPIPGMGEVPLIAIVRLLITDTTVHSWDIGRLTLDPELVSASFDWSRQNIMRRPGFFGPELTPPDDADEQTRLLAFLGRKA
ncbi:TIGR03086 family metal-binding protein [Kutzneria sp. CA-103260]|uniref:TIGR03086 family metal-binding protein n=1 Tax=Kutzneria sp. CA-103260 TaxID=2802641 RepID=UPI001BA5E83E|nr:TIGR03086 family metal-binding protein [Kutzneria sp. CA-103260]QUQ64701.1 TIGR03086 family protein [Kutzneria sp. CA-103260]